MAQQYTSDYETGEDNIKLYGLDVHNPVFFISASLIIAFVLVALSFPSPFNAFITELRAWSLRTFGNSVMFMVNGFLLLCLILVCSPLGSIRLGGREAKAEFKLLSWLAMLFAAGMGIGLMFWGVAEPMAYFTDWYGTPLGVAAKTPQAAELAMAATLYHWGLHAWAIYALVGLSLAFFAYNCDLPLTLRSAFYPLLGERCWRWPGHIIDTFAVLATIFGLATSLGLGASQVNAGLSQLFGTENTIAVKFTIIALVTAATIFSVVRGLSGGVKLLSNANIMLALLLLLFVIAVSSVSTSAKHIAFTALNYIENLIPLSNFTDRKDSAWMFDWTVFYWAWWVSWSPFVGLFIARISKGRTVREFLIAVVLLPTIVTIVWIGVFGMNAIEQAQQGIGSLASGELDINLATFQMLENLPFANLTTVVGLILVLVFFVTSSDSGSLVLDSITSGGKLNPPVAQRIFWAIMQGLIAAALLYGGGKQALGALQSGTVVTGIPFTLILVLICVCLVMGLYSNLKQERMRKHHT